MGKYGGIIIMIMPIDVFYQSLGRMKQDQFNPLSPHDALKHHFSSLIADLIFIQLRVF